jgi:hypothetical protein
MQKVRKYKKRKKKKSAFDAKLLANYFENLRI